MCAAALMRSMQTARNSSHLLVASPTQNLLIPRRLLIAWVFSANMRQHCA